LVSTLQAKSTGWLTADLSFSAYSLIVQLARVLVRVDHVASFIVNALFLIETELSR
jgi:hypothetical protein